MVHIYREKSTDQGTFGYMVAGDLWWHTLELPWRDNRQNISCIPTGEYEVVRRYSPHFAKELYWIRNVHKRSWILIHAANFAGDTELGWQSHLQGCIAIGGAVGSAINRYGERQRCIFRSANALFEMETQFEREPFKLIIEEL